MPETEPTLYVVRAEVHGLWQARWIADIALFDAEKRWHWIPPGGISIHRSKPSADRRRKPSEAMKWLRDRLLDGTVVSVEALRREGADAGFSPDQLERAKRRLGVEAVREGYGGEGRWYWFLPEGLDLAPDDGLPAIRRKHELPIRPTSRLKKRRR